MAKRTEHKRNPSGRFVSNELEVCGITTNGPQIANLVREWGGAIVHDGSLPDGGFEINTAPASGDLYVSQIERICAALADAHAFANEDAGMHVHVDARDFTYYDMRRLVKLYAHVEEQLFRTCRPHRRNNTYCMPCGPLYVSRLSAALTPKASKQALLRNVYKVRPGPEFKHTKREKYHSTRYHALNLHSWLYRGTVECRMYHGTVKAAGAVSWGMLWAGILDYAAKRTEKDIDAAIASTEPKDLLLTCAPTDDVRGWLRARWNFLAKDHATVDADLKASRREYERAYTREREAHQLNLRAMEQRIGPRPEWAVDYAITYDRTTWGAQRYAWVGPDDIYLEQFGAPNTGEEEPRPMPRPRPRPRQTPRAQVRAVNVNIAVSSGETERE